jgi:Fic family protein
VHIGAERRFVPPPPHEVMPCLYQLETYIHRETVVVDPLILCFMVHYQFETIHPFLDGNGRLGRLLLSLMIFQRFKLSQPWLYLSAFFEKHKDDYINLLFEVSAKGNWQDWISFCLHGTVVQSKDALARFDRLLALRRQYTDTLSQGGGSLRLSRLVERLFESPAITIPQFAEMCQISYNTAQTDIKKLVDGKILTESDIQERPKIYFASEILRIAFDD